MSQIEGFLSLSSPVHHACMSLSPGGSGAGDNMAKHSARQAATALGTVPTQLAELETMTVGQLAEKHRDLYGEPTRSRNKGYLLKRLAWRIQELAEGGLSPRSLAKIIELGDQVPARWQAASAPEATAVPPPTTPRDPRLPAPGTVLTRTHDGVQHEVTVGSDTFTYAGREFRSLSAVARDITGTAWNGWTFFGLKATTARAA